MKSWEILYKFWCKLLLATEQVPNQTFISKLAANISQIQSKSWIWSSSSAYKINFLLSFVTYYLGNKLISNSFVKSFTQVFSNSEQMSSGSNKTLQIWSSSTKNLTINSLSTKLSRATIQKFAYFHTTTNSLMILDITRAFCWIFLAAIIRLVYRSAAICSLV